METDQQHGDRGRAGDQAARDAEQRDLARGDVAAVGGELTGDLLRILAFVSILVMVRMLMIVLREGDLVSVGVVAVRQPQAGGELVRLGISSADSRYPSRSTNRNRSPEPSPRSVVTSTSSAFHGLPLTVRRRQRGGTPSSKIESSTTPWPVSMVWTSS